MLQPDWPRHNPSAQPTNLTTLLTFDRNNHLSYRNASFIASNAKKQARHMVTILQTSPIQSGIIKFQSADSGFPATR